MRASDIWLVGDGVACRTAQRWARECPAAVPINTVPASELAARAADPSAGPQGPQPWLVAMNSTTIVRRPVLERFEGRAVNIHPGRLPDFGGLYAVQWALRLGESATAATAHFMTEMLDAGDVIYATPVPIGPDETGLSLLVRCAAAQVEILKRLLTDIAEGRQLPRSKQDPSLRRVFKGADALGDQLPGHLHAIEAERWVRAGNWLPLSSSPYRPTLVIPKPALTLWLDKVAVADCGTALDLAPGEVRLRDGELMVGCAAGSALSVKRARVAESADLPAEWSRAVSNLAS
jgi:methionyl-tRNA formyltransferase